MFLNCLQLFYDKLRPVEASLSNPRIFPKKVILSFCSVITIRITKHLTVLHLNILIGCDSVAFCSYFFLLSVQHPLNVMVYIMKNRIAPHTTNGSILCGIIPFIKYTISHKNISSLMLSFVPTASLPLAAIPHLHHQDVEKGGGKPFRDSDSAIVFRLR